MRTISHALTLILMLMISSCYSVKFGSRDSSAEDLDIVNNNCQNYDSEEKVYYIDTTVSSPSKFMMNDCGVCKDGLYSVEYVVRLDYILLNMITFGTCNKVDIKYVCKKKDN